MRDGLLSQSEDEERWAVRNDLDHLFLNVYKYYAEKGFWCIFFSGLTNLLILAFTILFSTFLVLCVSWGNIFRADCRDEESCNQIVGLRNDIFTDPSFWDVIVMMYFVLFCIYWMWTLVSYVYDIRAASEMSNFFGEEIRISDNELPGLQWSVVVDRLVQLHKTRKLSLTKDDLSQLDITNRILRKENYMVAMMNQGILDISLPKWMRPWDDDDSQTAGTVGSSTLGKTLEWNIRWCILNYMFDTEFNISSSFVDDPERLRRRLVRCAIGNLILLPFTAFFMIIFFFLQNAEEFYSKKSFLGPRQWTPLARWKFREFNELPHEFEERLNSAHEPSAKYLAQFPGTVSSILARCVSYLAGAPVAVLLILTLTDSQLLVHFNVWGKPLLWYLAVLTVCLAVSRAFVESEVLKCDPEVVMNEAVKYTHYMPDQWKGRCHTVNVLRDFRKLYSPRTLLFLTEIWSVIVTPIILGWSLAQCSEQIVEFVRRYTVSVEGVGDVCHYSRFPLAKLGDPSYLAPKLPHSEPNSLGGSSRDSTPAAQGKMEKSFLSFAINNPNWEVGEEGSQLFKSLSEVPINTLNRPIDLSASRIDRGIQGGERIELQRTQFDSSVLDEEPHTPPMSESSRPLMDSFSTILNANKRPVASWKGPLESNASLFSDLERAHYSMNPLGVSNTFSVRPTFASAIPLLDDGRTSPPNSNANLSMSSLNSDPLYSPPNMNLS